MKKLSVLKDWTKILFILSCIIAIFIPGVILMKLISPDMVPFKFTINDKENFSFGAAIVSLIILSGFCLFLYALYLFRKVLELFSKKKIFDNEVIINFKKMGQFTWYGLFATTIPGIAYGFFTEEGIKINLDAEWVCYVLFTGSLALFFMVLSEVFQMAKNIKEENDLTV